MVYEDYPSINTPINSERLNKSCITAYPEVLENLETDLIPMQHAIVQGNKFSLVDGGIKIGASVSMVELSAQIWYYANGSTSQWFTLMKNNMPINTILTFATEYNSVSFAPLLLNVVEGDVITMHITSRVGSESLNINTGHGMSDAIPTYITIKEI